MSTTRSGVYPGRHINNRGGSIRVVLIIDNYDSFTYNLVQYLGELGAEPRVIRNDALTVDEVIALAPESIVISPGPCTPNEAGISLELIRRLAGTVPMLGVCLGHQAIGQVFGARVVLAPVLMHGKTSPVYHAGEGIHAGLPNPFTATRYHSLTLATDSIPDVLKVTAWTESGDVMAVEHRDLPVYGVQYHPESIMTEGGKDLLRNFLRISHRVATPHG
ncbi:MAG: anthranilate synthetase component [Chlorobi bacterium]|nr:anthranilate synthetase component [Chlorobiota bacterium]